MKIRLNNPNIKSYNFNERFHINGVKVSFHPAGHILGSSQVRIEYKGKVVVITGDYKRTLDYSCEKFEIVECDELISESTFAMPYYKWDDPLKVAKEIIKWSSKEAVLFCYSLGKSQQVIALLNKLGFNDIYVHSTIDKINKVYLEEGIELKYHKIDDLKQHNFKGITILPSILSMNFKKRVKTASLSGWNMLRSTKKRTSFDAAFTLSGHADWNEIIETLKDSKAKTIYFHHGKSSLIRKFLKEKGYNVGEI